MGVYHHYELIFDTDEVSSRFNDIRFVLVAGCARRAERQASYLAEHLFNGLDMSKHQVNQLTGPTSRFTLFKIGPVLVSNHGMGCPSMSIALHELFLMCRQADVIDKITVLRFGTCGGVGVPPGSICITDRALDPLLQDFVELKICLRLVKRPCIIDTKTLNKLLEIGKSHRNTAQLGEYEIFTGATIATNDFYEEQGRTNGAICEHSHEDKVRFMKRIKEAGVINIEMESNHLAAMCHKLNLSFGIVCVALSDRLNSEVSHLTKYDLSLFERRLFWLNLSFIKSQLIGSN